MSESWYYCLDHKQVEGEAGCPNKRRLGPYPTRDQAEHALQKVAERNEAWKKTGED